MNDSNETTDIRKYIDIQYLRKINRLCSNEYPTQEFLEAIKRFSPSSESIWEFLEIIKSVWWPQDTGMGFVLKRQMNGKRALELHTNGWSGNEDIMYALRANFYFFPLFWLMTKKGGHYYFRIPVKIV